MTKNKSLAAVLAVVMLLFAAPAAMAQADEDKVLLTVNGAEIRVSDIRLAAENLVDPLTKVKPNERYVFVVQYLVERQLLAQEAMAKKIEDNAGYKKLLAFYQAKAARDAYFATAILPLVTDQQVRAEYDKQVAEVDGQVRTHLLKIEAADEVAINKIHADLIAGGDFAKVADANTPEGVAKSGGDIGWYTAEEMLTEMAAVVKDLKDGETSKPFKSKFGWLVVKVVERKTSKAQPFEKVQAGLKALLARQKVQEVVDALRKKAVINVVDPDLQKLEVKQ